MEGDDNNQNIEEEINKMIFPVLYKREFESQEKLIQQFETYSQRSDILENMLKYSSLWTKSQQTSIMHF